MSPLEFRAWIKDRKIMEYDIQNPDRPFSHHQYFHEYLQDPNCVVRQYTGLKDKNGKEIYEGDIVNFTGIVTAPNDSFGKTYEEKCVIEFDTGCFKPFNSPYSNGESCEIIGNIYENPELLKEGKVV